MPTSYANRTRSQIDDAARPRRTTPAPAPSSDALPAVNGERALTGLQRSAGNRAVQRLFSSPQAGIQRQPEGEEEEGFPWMAGLPFASRGLDVGLHAMDVAEGVGGMWAGPLEMMEGAKKGGVMGGIQAGAGTLETGAGLGEAIAAGAGEASALGAFGEGMAALGPVGLVAGAGVGGAELGGYLEKNTSVGEHAQETLGGFDAMMTEPGEQSWLLSQYESAGENWDKGNYGSAILNGAKVAGGATLGALGGIGGGLVDAGSAALGGLEDLGSSALDLGESAVDSIGDAGSAAVDWVSDLF